VFMEAELLSESRRPRKAAGVFQSEAQGLRMPKGDIPYSFYRLKY
jgi:hypothetical protein